MRSAVTTGPAANLGSTGMACSVRASSGSPPVNLTLPLIDNSFAPQVFETLYVSNGTWSEAISVFEYQWLIDGSPVFGATNPSFSLGSFGYEGSIVTCEVTAIGLHGNTTVSTAGTAAVLANGSGAAVLKLYADNISGIVTDPVATWPDKSGLGNDDTQGTPAVQPLLNSGPNGNKDVLFDGVSQFLNMADFSSLTEAHMFLVFKNTTTGNGNGIYRMGGAGADDPKSFIPFSGNTGIYDAFFTTTRHNDISEGSITAGWHIYEVASKSGSWFINLDGSVIYSTGTNTVSAPSNGLFGSSGAGSTWAGECAARVMFGTVLSSGNADNVRAYLKARYATP